MLSLLYGRRGGSTYGLGIGITFMFRMDDVRLRTGLGSANIPEKQRITDLNAVAHLEQLPQVILGMNLEPVVALSLGQRQKLPRTVLRVLHPAPINKPSRERTRI